MTLFKRVIKSAAVRRTLCWMGAGYIRLVHLTGRWQVEGGAIPRDYWDHKRPFILCFWHGRLMMMPRAWDDRQAIHMLISHHRDGRLIADTVSSFGIKTVAGSSSKGGARALREMVKLLAGGACVGVTPDGPRGPRMRASAGTISLARLAGVPILPATFSVSRGWNLGSWDRFLVGRPFSRGVFVWGQPIDVARDADAGQQERARLALEDELNRITLEADRLCGRTPVAPAEVAGDGSS